MPRTVMTDARVFTSRAATRYFAEKSIDHSLTVPYAPETNGLVERANAKVLSLLRKNLNGNMDHRSEYLRETTFQVNNQQHVGLHTSPFQLLYNYVPRRTINNKLSAPTQPQDQALVRREEAQNTLTDYLHDRKHKYDAKHPPPPFSVGDEVWYHKGSRPTKLGPMYDGPYTIAGVEKETYIISKKGTAETRLATARKLKLFLVQPSQTSFKLSQSQTREQTTPQLQDDPAQATEAPVATDDRCRLRKPPHWLEEFVTD
ncbi:hypothetical protein MTO96_047433 [Rhipicephalus appendiculatus]